MPLGVGDRVTSEAATPTEDDIVLDTDGYQTTCVICGEVVTAEKGSEPTIRTFSFGFGPDTAFCSGVLFLCEKHADHDQAGWCLAQRIAQLAGEIA